MGSERSDRGGSVQNATEAPEARLAVLGDRRNGVDRLSLIGTLDRSTVQILATEVDGVAHAGGAVVLDLRNLEAVDVAAVRVLEALTRRAVDEGWFLFLVCLEPARAAFERGGALGLLSGDVSQALSDGEGDWTPVSLPPLPGQRERAIRQRILEGLP
jgi:anti-anti-sigma regulatory factor